MITEDFQFVIETLSFACVRVSWERGRNIAYAVLWRVT